MHPDWSTFLEARTATRADATAQTPDCALIDLSHLGLIAVRGPDAVNFLQGQVSNDVREVSATHTQLSSHCSPKGRMLANFRVLQDNDGLLLVLPRVQLAPLLARLRLFLLRSQATVTDVSDDLVSFGVIGTCDDAPLTDHFGALPPLEGGLVRQGEAALMRIPGEPSRYQVIAPVATAQGLWDAIGPPLATVADAHHWALADIRAGIPTVLPETADAFVPQMVNMHLIDGVSFHKGCYCGQEVVARMQYLGKLKRRMYYAQVASDQPPAPGTPLVAPGSSSEQGPGRVVDARLSAPGMVELLAVVEIAVAEGGEVRLAADGPALALMPPPYGLPSEV